MALLVRKINRNKWPNEIIDVFNLSADAISSCIRTTQQTISVWKIENEEQLPEAVLALASNFQRLEAFDVVILDSTELSNRNIEIENTKGITPVQDLENSHFDLVKIDYYKLGLLGEHIVNQISQKLIRRFTISDLKSILIDAIENNRLNKEDLSDSIIKKL